MLWYSFLFILLLAFGVNVDSRRFFDKHQTRQLWKIQKEKFKDKAVNKFHIDMRHFDKENMILFPDVAYQSLESNNTWKIMVHGWRYENNKGKDWFIFKSDRWLEKFAGYLLDQDDILYFNRSINYDRLKLFIVEDESNELIKLKLDEKTYLLRTDQHGQFYEEIEVTNNEMQKLKQNLKTSDIITYEAIGDNQDKLTGIIRLIEPRQGISIISDIDDTIKISEVLDKIRLLANTFIFPFKPVPGKLDKQKQENKNLSVLAIGMAKLYQKWHSNNNNCTFHYLSGMPDQLYPLTNEFINTHNFPDGSFHMRHFGWSATSLFNFLHSHSTFRHKISYLRFFLSNTIRDYVLVGDSGEKDPEIYAAIAIEYPERIRAIFIRAIKGEKFDDQRFLTAFKEIPRKKWQVFDDPKQLPIDLS